MKRNLFSLFVAVTFLVVGDLQSTPTPTPTPTPTAGRKTKTMVVATPTPTAPPKRIKGIVVSPTSTPIKIDKGTKIGPGPTPIRIGKDRIKAEPTQAPIKVIKTQVSTPTPIKILRKDVNTPTPTPQRFSRDKAVPTVTPSKMPVEGTIDRKKNGPVIGATAMPGRKRLVPGNQTLENVTTPVPALTNPVSKGSDMTTLAPGPGAPPPAPPQPTDKIPSDSSVPVVDGNTPTSRNTDTPENPRGYANTLSSKLAVYTKEGKGVTQTNLGGEFPSKLETTATVSKVFAVQWSRDKAGPSEKGNLGITKQGSTVPLSTINVTMPAQAKETNIEFTMPNVAPATYQMMVAGETGNSNMVRLFYTGEGGSGSYPAVPVPTNTAPPPGSNPGAPAMAVELTRFWPMQGLPGQPGYKKAKLSFRITSANDMTVPSIYFAVDSAAFTDSSSVTQSGPASYGPLRLFEKQYSPPKGTSLKAGEARNIGAISLEPTSDFNWNLAYGKTDNATFRWSISGQGDGSATHPLKTNWP